MLFTCAKLTRLSYISKRIDLKFMKNVIFRKIFAKTFCRFTKKLYLCIRKKELKQMLR